LPTEEASASELGTRRSLGILLNRFVCRTGAAEARVVGRETGEAMRTWALYERERETSEGDPSPRWNRLAREAMLHGRAHFDPDDRDGSGAVLAMPIIVRDHTAGALCSSYREELGSRAPAVLWTADGYARAMALALDEPDDFGRLVGMARRDPLTGCHNSASLWEAIEDEIARAARLQTRLTCAFLDLDGFKAVNDNDGHLAGDSVLAAVGAALSDGVRRYDTVARFGGDEFVLLMPGVSAAEAQATIERLRAGVVEAAAALTSVPVTISAGVAQWDESDDATTLLERADRGLLAEKALRG
jgi:diguanylate cyclase (GGDEF)-like protein